MKKSQIVELLESLDATEWDEFSLFIEAEFHNRGYLRKEIIQFFNIIKSHKPAIFEIEDGLMGEAVFAMVYPNKAFIQGKLDKIASELKKLVRHYLLWKAQEDEENTFQQSFTWSKILRRKGLDNQYDLQIDRLERWISEKKQQSLDDLLHFFLLEREKYFWTGSKNPGKTEENLVVFAERFWLFAEAYRLELANSILIRQSLVQIEPNEAFQKLINLSFFDTLPTHQPLIEIPSQILKLLKMKTPESEAFYALIRLLKEQENNIDPDILKYYYSYLRSLGSILSDTIDKFRPIVHEIQKDNLERGYFYHDGQIPALSLLSISRAANLTHETAWALEFVQAHRGRILGEDDSESFYNITLASCHFETGEFQLVLDLLPPTCENITFYLFARRLEIMSYYELKSDLTIYKIDAHKIYLRRASGKFLSTHLYNQNMNFTNIVHQLLLSVPGDIKRADKIIDRIKTNKSIGSSIWLLKKCEELKITRL